MKSKEKKKSKSKSTTIILIIVCVIGLSLLLYPTVSNYWNMNHATHTISHYIDSVQNLNEEEYQKIWTSAIQYNKDLLDRTNPFELTNDLRSRYFDNLNFSGDGVMGYLEIGKLDVALPIYHGTSEGVLQIAVGHIDWSSIPTGGESTHCVLSGHRGLPSARLFTDLDKLNEGDIFTLNILDETLTYEVDQIRTVLPGDVSDLQIVKGMDYCTLLTCTPYGINTHRLLVRGHRIENIVAEAHVVSEAVIIDPLIVAPVIAFPLLFILLMMVMLKRPEKKPNTSTVAAAGDITNSTNQKTKKDKSQKDKPKRGKKHSDLK